MAKQQTRHVYRRGAESVSKRTRESGGVFDSYLSRDIPMLKVSEGESTLRIIRPHWLWPDFPEAEQQELISQWGDGWEIKVVVHYSVGPDNSTYLCLDKMKGERCPICEARAAAEDEEDRDALSPSNRHLCWVVDRDDEKAGPQVWSLPPKLFREINGRTEDRKSHEVLQIDDPDEGYDIMFTREGTDKRTSYSGVEIARDPTPLHDNPKTLDRWLAYVEDHPLYEMLEFYDAEHLDRVLSGRVSRRSADADEEEGSARGGRGGSARSGRRTAAEDEEEEGVSRGRGGRGADPSRSARGSNGSGEEEEEAGEAEPRRAGRSVRSRADADEEEESGDLRTSPKRSSRRSSDEEESEPRQSSRTRRSAPPEEPEEADESDQEEEDNAPPPSRGARADMGRLRSRASRR